MPGLKRTNGSAPLPNTNKKPKLQEIAPPQDMATITIEDQTFTIQPGEDHVAMLFNGLTYVTNKLRRQGIQTEPTFTSQFTTDVFAYLDNATAILEQNLESFIKTIAPMLAELNKIFNKPRTRSTLIDNQDAILARYLEKAYSLDQLIQAEIKPLLNKYDELRTNLVNYLKFDPSNQKLIETQKFIDTTDALLAAQKTSVNEQVENQIANKSLDSLQLKPEIEAWVETIKPTAIVANATPVATLS